MLTRGIKTCGRVLRVAAGDALAILAQAGAARAVVADGEGVEPRRAGQLGGGA